MTAVFGLSIIRMKETLKGGHFFQILNSLTVVRKITFFYIIIYKKISLAEKKKTFEVLLIFLVINLAHSYDCSKANYQFL